MTCKECDIMYSRTPIDDGSVRLGDVKEGFVTLDPKNMDPTNLLYVHPNWFVGSHDLNARVWLVDVEVKLKEKK